MIGTDVGHAAELLRAGKLVSIPTETVYGLAANALDTNAVLSIFKAKDRPSFDPLIVHINNVHQLGQLTTEVPSLALKLAQKFCPFSSNVVCAKIRPFLATLFYVKIDETIFAKASFAEISHDIFE